jgi:uncharacterized membrane protein
VAKTLLLYTMAAFYFVAGVNHFVNPQSYIGLFPPYFKPYAVELNAAAGIAEVVLAFTPSHIYMIQKGNFPMFGFTVTPTISVVRLVIFHPLLMYWAYHTAIKP